jgi:hypothetical protein
MKRIRAIFKTTLVAIVLSVIAVSMANAQQPLSVACEPYGSVTINGSPASDNMLVIAYIGDIELARTTTEGGQYSLLINLDDPDTPQREGYQPGDIISIRVNGNPAVTLSVRLETWGRIKALFK